MPSFIQNVPSPVDTALILICEKCGKKLNSENNPAVYLQQSLKTEIKQQNLKGKVRAVLSSCLDICPENRIAVGISYANSKDAFFTVAADDLPKAQKEVFHLAKNPL
jgi:hypothetical protein